MSKTLFILNDPPYGTERRCNALRLAGLPARRPGDEVKLLLMDDAASCAKANLKVPQDCYSIELMLQGSTSRNGVEIAVCGTCMDARGISDAELADETRRSSLSQVDDWTDKMPLF